ncbi:unnamed protein product [Ectocarpus sp. 4 AP-2014]
MIPTAALRYQGKIKTIPNMRITHFKQRSTTSSNAFDKILMHDETNSLCSTNNPDSSCIIHMHTGNALPAYLHPHQKLHQTFRSINYKPQKKTHNLFRLKNQSNSSWETTTSHLR